MRHWSILAAFGLGSAALSAQVPDPGEIALAASRAPAVLTLPPVAAIKAPAPDGRAATPSSPIHTNLISVASTSPASGEESLPKLLAPPPEPAPAPAIKSPISAPVAPPSAPLSTPKTAQEIVPDDGGIPTRLIPFRRRPPPTRRKRRLPISARSSTCARIATASWPSST